MKKGNKTPVNYELKITQTKQLNAVSKKNNRKKHKLQLTMPSQRCIMIDIKVDSYGFQ